MVGSMKKKIILLLLLTIFVVGIDQIIKLYVTNNLQGQNVNIGFINLEYSKNTGIAFGLAKDNTKTIVLTEFVVILVIVAFFIRQLKNIDTKTSIIIAMILSGGIGNLIDRLFLGGVIDYINIGNIIPKFPIFNFSDCLIVIGLILFVIFTFREFANIKSGKFMEEQRKKFE